MPNTKSLASSLGSFLLVSATLASSSVPTFSLSADDKLAAEQLLSSYLSGVTNKKNVSRKVADKPAKPISLEALQKAIKVASGGSTERLRRELMNFIVERITLHGLDFMPSAENEIALRASGASDEVMAAVQAQARQLALRHEEQEWQTYAQSRQPEVVQSFLEKYPSSRFAEAARERLEVLHWERIQDSTKTEDFKQFLASYPNSAKTVAALSRIELLAWENAQAGGRDEDFALYLEAFPQGTYVASAQQRRSQLAWEAIKHSNQLASFMAFVEQYRQGPLVDAARIRIEQLRWEATLKGGRQKDFEDYLRHYPQGHFAVAARERIDRLVNPERFIKKTASEDIGKPLRITEEELREALIGELKPQPLSNRTREKVVKVRVVLAEDATIKTVEYVSGSRSLSASALMLVRQWTFRPVKRNDEPVSVEGIVTVQFPATPPNEAEPKF